MRLIQEVQRFLTLICLSVVAMTAAAETGSSVWQVSDGDHVLYLGGTVHVLRQQDYPLPVEFDRAFLRADRLVFETDLAQLQSVAVQQRMQQAIRYGDGSGLSQRLSAELYQRLESVWQHYGLPVEVLNELRPSGVVITLTMLNLKQMGVDAQGIDDFYYTRAMQQGKPVSGLESVDQQIDFLSRMGEGDEETFMRLSLDELDESAALIDEILTAWRRGHLDELEHLLVDDMRRDFPAQYQTLLVGRNQHWMPQIKNMLRDRPVELVLVGSGHLAGEDGLIEQLQLAGYQVKRLL
ncbi:TraB/GumN family protein [Amphritea sp. 1_MG-2023]|uniref:TraB/GumN family protein n=1 Tax=Amphritea sp. 1_MG-2023 TaxID=3062670 RepID=UPI0026E1B84A|nr:TraB/GumN family protein [Amphritea sp. 1_MG-2023]MDO6561763.1 TraB/GumN family protein [Amphritea sp. 1_MG-2023]